MTKLLNTRSYWNHFFCWLLKTLAFTKV